MMFSSILILVVAFLTLIALMIVHEFGHFIIAKKFGVRVEEFGIGYPPRMFGKKFGETIYSVNWLPLGAFVRIYGEEGGVDDSRSFQNLKIWQRVLIVIGGVAAFWLAAIVLFSIVFAIGTVDLPVGDQDLKDMTNPRLQVMSVSSDSPASQAGVKTGDIITSAYVLSTDSSVKPEIIKIDKIKDFQDFTKQNGDKPSVVVVKRGAEELEIPLTPRLNPPAGEGSVGVSLERLAAIKKYPLYEAPFRGAIYTWQTTVNALVALWNVLRDLFVGRGLPQGAAFAGPLGITVFLANAASFGVGFFLYFIGVISVLIAIFNLFPIPALDGGKLVFLLIEKIKGKPVSAKVEQGITVVFFAILICLSIFITLKFDIQRVSEFITMSLQK